MKIWDTVNRCLLLVNRYLITILLPDFLYAIQITIQLTGHSAIKHILTICVLDVSCNRITTVFVLDTLFLFFRSVTSTTCRRPRLRQLPNGAASWGRWEAASPRACGTSCPSWERCSGETTETVFRCWKSSPSSVWRQRRYSNHPNTGMPY